MPIKLTKLTKTFDHLFLNESFGPDPAMSRFVPVVYQAIGYDWQHAFEPDFVRLFNGLMIAGAPEVNTVYCSVFPTSDVLDSFLKRSNPGDLLFLHHPIDMECGDPRGKWGRGFIGINPETISRLKEAQLSVYTCHAPMDTNLKIGTTIAIVAAIGARVVGEFFPYGKGNAGRICEIPPCSTKELTSVLLSVFHIPYVDYSGSSPDKITKIAVVAGSGDKVEYFREAESVGAQAYIAGEIHARIDNDYGREKMRQAEEYMAQSSMSFFGVSHAASEYLVMETQIKPFLTNSLGIQCETIPLPNWWR